jgi:hypothetical protein
MLRAAGVPARQVRPLSAGGGDVASRHDCNTAMAFYLRDEPVGSPILWKNRAAALLEDQQGRMNK